MKTESLLRVLWMLSLLVVFPSRAFSGAADAPAGRLENQVRRALIQLPFYGMFDHFQFRVEGSEITLMGKVTRPTLKSDAERVVGKIEGVERVVNRVEVLPLSPQDDRMRLRLQAAIYGHSLFQTSAFWSLPPVHLVVENGNVTLEGVVAGRMHKTIAELQANSVDGVFSVKNNLQIEKERKKEKAGL